MRNYYTNLREQYITVDSYRLVVANEVHDTLIDSEEISARVKLDTEQYEEVCDYVYDYIMSSTMSVGELTDLIHDAILSNEPIIDLILNGQWEDANEIIYARM